MNIIIITLLHMLRLQGHTLSTHKITYSYTSSKYNVCSLMVAHPYFNDGTGHQRCHLFLLLSRLQTEFVVEHPMPQTQDIDKVFSIPFIVDITEVSGIPV